MNAKINAFVLAVFCIPHKTLQYIAQNMIGKGKNFVACNYLSKASFYYASNVINVMQKLPALMKY